MDRSIILYRNEAGQVVMIGKLIEDKELHFIITAEGLTHIINFSFSLLSSLLGSFFIPL